jgi:small subunit ribosomal protein S16
MLMIRLSRVGKTKHATYKIIIQEKSKDPWGDVLEFLGTYDPHTKELKIKEDRIKHWTGVGAKMSATINNLLIRKGIIKGKKMKTAKFGQDKAEKMEAAKLAAAKVKAEEKKAEEKKEPVAEAPKEEVKEEVKPVEEVKKEESAPEVKSEENKPAEAVKTE